MGVKQLRNSSTINNINTSTKQILVSAWTVETHTHTNTHTSHKIKGDRQPKRAKQHREEECSRGRWKPARVLKAVQNYFLKKYQSAVIFSCAPRVYITTNIERMKLQLREGAQRGRTRSNKQRLRGFWRPTRSWDLYLDVEAEESAISQLLVWKSQIGPDSLLINLSDDCETQLHCSTDSRHLWLFGKHVTFAVCFILDVVIGLDYLVWCYWFVLDSSFCLVYQSVKIRKNLVSGNLLKVEPEWLNMQNPSRKVCRRQTPNSPSPSL